jgi:hypothetical protein
VQAEPGESHVDGPCPTVSAGALRMPVSLELLAKTDETGYTCETMTVAAKAINGSVQY